MSSPSSLRSCMRSSSAKPRAAYRVKVRMGRPMTVPGTFASLMEPSNLMALRAAYDAAHLPH